MRLAFVFIGLLAVSSVGRATPPDPTPHVLKLVEQLGDEEFERREAAERELLEFGPSIDPILKGLEPTDAEVRVRLKRVRDTFARGMRLRELRDEKGEPTGAGWVELRAFLATSPSKRVREMVLKHGGAPADAAARLERATAFAKRFVLEWNEMYGVGSEEEKRYAALERELRAHGAAALPALLDVLAVDMTEAFGRTSPKRGVSARMQVRAIFGASWTGDPVILPQLVRHARNPSFTATMNAVAALEKFAGRSFRRREGVPAPDLIDAWWKENRARYEK